jgi:hypothetical protein
VQGKLPEIVEEAEDALIKSGLRIYQRAGFLVRVVRRDTPSVRTTSAGRRARSASSRSTRRISRGLHARGALGEVEREEERMADCGCKCARAGGGDVPRAPRALAAAAPVVGDQLADPATRWHGAAGARLRRATQSWYDPCGIEFPKIPRIADARGRERR